nr:hypothetical protein CFP56_33418 [Quercus suber]
MAPCNGTIKRYCASCHLAWELRGSGSKKSSCGFHSALRDNGDALPVKGCCEVEADLGKQIHIFPPRYDEAQQSDLHLTECKERGTYSTTASSISTIIVPGTRAVLNHHHSVRNNVSPGHPCHLVLPSLPMEIDRDIVSFEALEKQSQLVPCRYSNEPLLTAIATLGQSLGSSDAWIITSLNSLDRLL